jgi:hypothetical protein
VIKTIVMIQEHENVPASALLSSLKKAQASKLIELNTKSSNILNIMHRSPVPDLTGCE